MLSVLLNTSYLGHLGLNPGGFEGRHGLLRCSWTVKIHEAVTCRRGEGGISGEEAQGGAREAGDSEGE